ncbi:hydroxymethylpyrimidine/phosphomethylpyrimidine kinase [Salegentibacter salegens]|uniref:hydroxymethylpyrimidine kinase n=1 Tax=Salegentibacter salegens TaxID=143223 RepID=A0A1M7J0R9_9FLAO|nr:hydroxymethylpyrimidine/phosphomethylpyrimidine kinase [Salegentibacter salegens]PRX49881.1 hydroxymethylpyrimidine/phosphomethylpyrimidine kinase [Salegentibacter salegens]SHM46513.1 hydroxymethylpyrimidine/phosphomethylpyrimidine kinase [Salegentibacter salegens]
MSMHSRPFVLSIAGFDPTGGAGLLADIKTIEGQGCYGVAVNTANTIQNDVKFEACHWTSEAIILQQLELLLECFPIEVVKIGIVENLQILNKVISTILLRNKDIRIIWDPVLKSTSGFSFHDPKEFQKDINSILENIFVVTPNFDEGKLLYAGLTPEETIRKISSKTNLHLKGGHRMANIGLDELFTTKGECLSLEPVRKDCSEKHGSGCIFSSALAAHLALGESLPEAARKAKIYIEKILASNNTLLAYHNL